MKNTKKTRKKIKTIFGCLTAAVTVTGIDIYTAIQICSQEFDKNQVWQVSKTWVKISSYLELIKNNFFIITLIVYVIFLVSALFIIPNCKNKENEQRLKPSVLQKIFWYSGLGCFIIISVTSLMFASNLIKDNQLHHIDINAEDLDTSKDALISDQSLQTKNITQPKDIVESYIIRCETEVIQIDEWVNLSNEELYYIRNGIFAYVGYPFDSGYYDKYSWYAPIDSPTAAKERLNSCQWENIEKIKMIEQQRTP